MLRISSMMFWFVHSFKIYDYIIFDKIVRTIDILSTNHKMSLILLWKLKYKEKGLKDDSGIKVRVASS